MHLLAALALFLQDKTAEESFKKIEETIDKAKTVSVKFKVDGHYKQGERETKVQMSGTIALKEGNKAHIAYKRRIGEQETDADFVSDGKKSKTKGGGTEDAPGNITSNFKVAVSQIGVFFSSRAASVEEHNGVRKEVMWKERFLVSEIKVGPDDKDAKTLTYKLKVGSGEALDVQIWYEPRTWRILKRTLSGNSGGKEVAFTEVYEECLLEVDIPDEKFKLPSD